LVFKFRLVVSVSPCCMFYRQQKDYSSKIKFLTSLFLFSA
jgi:hypothetical protein